MEPGRFTCSICGDPSRAICVYCTKDACDNHLCERCLRCSDCCECGVRMDEPTSVTPAEHPESQDEILAGEAPSS
jgi:hypothetical protein